MLQGGGWIGGGNGGAQLNGVSTRTALMFSNPIPRQARIKIRFPVYTHDIKLMVYSSAYGDSGYEVGVEGSDIVVRPVVLGEVGSNIDDDAHGWSGTAPHSITVDLLKGGIKVYLDDDLENPILDVAASSLTQFTKYDNAGYASDVDGALVTDVTVEELDPVFDAAGEIAVIVAGGSFYATNNAGELVLIDSGVFAASGYVSLTTHRQVVYGFDGQNARKFDLSTFEVSAYTPSSGDLPGKDGAGTTRATLAHSHRDRVVVSGDPVDPQNAFFTRIGNPDNIDVTETTDGAAFALSTARPGLIGEPIRSIITVTNNVILFGCNRSVWRFYGDPVLGVDIGSVTTDYGASAPDSMAFIAEGMCLMHSPDGFVVIAGDSASSISDGTLKKYLEQSGDDRGTRRTQVRRDPSNNGTHIFLPVPQAESPSVHFWYDDRIGNYAKGQGGFFPDTFAVEHEPLATCFYRGQLLLCCRDGYVRVFDADALDDDGVPISSLCGILLDEGDLTHEIILSRLAMILGEDSGPVSYRVVSGTTPQEAFTGQYRQTLLVGSVGGLRPHRDERRVRGSALVLEIYQEASAAPWRLDRLEVMTRPGRMMRRRSNVPLPVPPDRFPAPQSDSSAESAVSSGPGAESDFNPYAESFVESAGSAIPYVELTLFSYDAPDLDLDGLPDYQSTGSGPPQWPVPSSRNIILDEIVAVSGSEITLRHQETVSGGTITTSVTYNSSSGEWSATFHFGHFQPIESPSSFYTPFPSVFNGQVGAGDTEEDWYGGDLNSPIGTIYPLSSGGPNIDSTSETKVVYAFGVAHNLPISGANDEGFSAWSYDDVEINDS